MPVDKMGGYHRNDQAVRSHDEMGKAAKVEDPHEGSESLTVHDHGDGTFHTEHSDGTKEEHPDHLHAVAHIAHKISGGDKHHISHHDGMTHHAHGINEDGSHEETEDAGDVEGLKQHLGNFFGNETADDGGDEGGAKEPQIDGGY